MRRGVVQRMTRRGGPVDRARELQDKLGARPYRLFLVWQRWSGDEPGDGRAGPALRYEVLPRPKVLGYAGLTRNPTAIGIVPAGSLRVTEVPLWISFAALKGREHPERGARPLGPPADAREFFYEVETDERDDSMPPQRFRLSAEPERDESRATWILVLERQGTADRPER